MDTLFLYPAPQPGIEMLLGNVESQKLTSCDRPFERRNNPEPVHPLRSARLHVPEKVSLTLLEAVPKGVLLGDGRWEPSFNTQGSSPEVR